MRAGILFALVVSITGCGGMPASVSGTVSVDGKPVDHGTVTFAPTSGGMRALGLIQPDGSYSIKTNRESGLEVGEYQVAVVSREVRLTGPNGPPMPGKYITPKKYGNPKTSGLRYTVESGSNVIDLELPSAEE